MKKLIAIAAAVACLILTLFGAGAVSAYAETITVSGTVDAGSHDDILKLNCSDGLMELKLDSATDFSNVKSLLPGQKLTVQITYGNDEYWHVSAFTEGGAVTTSATIDHNTEATVTGKITGVVSEGILKLQLKEGEMQLKLDPTTDYSAISYLMVGNTYNVRVARGSDSYMHAISFAPGTSSIGYSGSNSSYISPSVQLAATQTVKGTVGSKSNSTILYLNCPEGEMQIKLDALNKAHVLYHGQQITVGIGYDNEYWHAVTITE